MPPLAQIYDFMEPRIAIGQLSFVDDQAGIHVSLAYCRNDAVERYHFVGEIGSQGQPQRQKGSSSFLAQR